MIYEEFKNYKIIEDKNNPFSNLYLLDSGERFYIEPVFYTQLMGFKDHYPEKMDEIINYLISVVKKNKKVIFTGCYDNPLTLPNEEGYIILEITDITDKLKIFVEDKSRGSDYGD